MGKFLAVFKMIAQSVGLDTAIAKARSGLNSVGDKLGDGLKSQVGKVFSVSAAFTMLKGTMEEVLNRAKQYNNLGKRMGIPATEVQRLDKAAEAAGINVASLSRSMQLVQKFGGEAFSKSSKKAEDLGKRLNLTNEQMLAMRSGGTEGLAVAADALMRVADAGERSTMGMQIFGEKWPEIKALVEGGGEAIRNAGKDQTVWGDTTQDSLTRTQKAWANMWNDLSVATAQLLEGLEPLIGILRAVGNLVMMLARIVIHGLVNGFEMLTAVLLAVGYGLMWIADKLGFEGADKGMKEIEKRYGDMATRMEKRNKLLGENLQKDGAGMEKGVNMLFGAKTGEEVVIKPPTEVRSTDTRTQEEKNKYEAALKKQDEIAISAKMANASEEEKLVLLQEQLMLLKKQEEELKKKHPERYKETEEYLELQNKMAEQQEKIAKAARDNEARLYKNRVEFMELANKRRLARMKDAGASEDEIEEESLRQKKEKAIRLSRELGELYKDPFAKNEDTQKKAKELAEAIADAEDDVYKARAEAMKNNNGAATVSSLQKIGGGGAVAIAGIAVRQLRSQERSEAYLKELRDIADKRGLGAVVGGTYTGN